ncbi:MAG TPA: response regulator [Methanobacterium sp.]|nr:response regulator [Methanobacterium sp.]
MDKHLNEFKKGNFKILIVEDEGIIALELQNKLQNEGYEVPSTVSSGKAAIEKAIQIKPDLILMDISLRGKINGIEAAERIKKTLDVPIIYITANQNEKIFKKAKKTEPYAYILKPFQHDELEYTIEIALYRSEVELKLKKILIENKKLLEELNLSLQNFLEMFYSLNNFESREMMEPNPKLNTMQYHTEINNHEKEFRNDVSFAIVDFPLYIESLIKDTLGLYNLNFHSIDLNLSIDNLMLDLNTSLISGLIINELVKNSIKNTNLEEDNYKINIDFHLENNKFVLSVNDGCTMYPESFYSQYPSFKLVNKLIKQINGNIILDQNKGSEIKVVFGKMEPINV